MKIFKLSDMINGWFVGPFKPSVINTDVCEVAVKSYKKGYCEKNHLHKIATEVTVIVSGNVKMNGINYSEGSIIFLEPGEETDFEVLSDSINVVFKIPGVKAGDKYYIER
jgi:hypothetical protein